MNLDRDRLIETIFSVFKNRGAEKYADEEVTQLQHAIQCAQLARESSEDEAVVVAALLHDIGHLLGEEDLPHSCDQNLHDAHEQAGYEFLLDGFGIQIAEMVRLHVAAKRYLCTKDQGYQNALSPTSLKSFFDQGGKMTADETSEFESNLYFAEALRLRRWDDQAKEIDKPMVEIADFLPELQSSIVKVET